MLRSFTNESPGSELDTIKFFMMGSDPGVPVSDPECTRAYSIAAPPSPLIACPMRWHLSVRRRPQIPDWRGFRRSTPHSSSPAGQQMNRKW
jgi:hypothetical protein